MELSKETIEEIYKDIHVSPKYMKHANKYQQYLKCGMYVEATKEARLMKQIENEIFTEIAKSYIDSNAHAVGVINSMAEQDRHSMNVIANAMLYAVRCTQRPRHRRRPHPPQVRLMEDEGIRKDTGTSQGDQQEDFQL